MANIQRHFACTEFARKIWLCLKTGQLLGPQRIWILRYNDAGRRDIYSPPCHAVPMAISPNNGPIADVATPISAPEVLIQQDRGWQAAR